MPDFDPTFAVRTAFPQSVAAYTSAGFGEACVTDPPGAFGAVTIIEVDPSTCKAVWADPNVSPRAKHMLESVMGDPHRFGFIALKGQTCAIAFRGTRTPADFLKDIQIDPEPVRLDQNDPALLPLGRVHGGFQALYRTLRPSIAAALTSLGASAGPLSLTVTGHSLGAALALLCAIDPITQKCTGAPRRVYTFAGPRVGDADFAQAFDSAIEDCFRIVNLPDLVPHLPLPVPYRHVGRAVVIDGFRFALDIPIDEHVLCGGYIRGLNRLVATGATPHIVRE